MSEWVKDLKLWDKAKVAFKKQYDKEPSDSKDFMIVTQIYKKMGGKISSEAYDVCDTFNEQLVKSDKHDRWTCPKCEQSDNDIEDKVCNGCKFKPSRIKRYDEQLEESKMTDYKERLNNLIMETFSDKEKKLVATLMRTLGFDQVAKDIKTADDAGIKRAFKMAIRDMEQQVKHLKKNNKPNAGALEKQLNMLKTMAKQKGLIENYDERLNVMVEGTNDLKTWEGSFTIKWYKNDSGDRRPLTIDAKSDADFNTELKRIKHAFMTKGEKGKIPFSVTFDMKRR